MTHNPTRLADQAKPGTGLTNRDAVLDDKDDMMPDSNDDAAAGARGAVDGFMTAFNAEDADALRTSWFHFPHVRFHSGKVTVMPQGNRVNGRDGALAATSPSSPALCRGPSPARIAGIGRIPQIDAAIGPRHKAGDDGEGKPAVRRRHSPDCPGPPHAVTLDIDDTVDVAHGHQQLSLFNGHYDERCFVPIHVYDTATSAPWRCYCALVPHRSHDGAINRMG